MDIIGAAIRELYITGNISPVPELLEFRQGFALNG
jgi:hypothetical protein